MNKRRSIAWLAGLAVLFGLGGSPRAAEQGMLLAAQGMLQSGQALEALELLEPSEEDFAGEKEFDYLYGLALLDTGDPARSVFAFQRALAVDPNFAGARLELARAYYDMGQLQRSQREFLLLQSQSPPAGVSQIIDEYLAAIESRNLGNRRGWSGYIQLGLGDDSNANNATSTSSFLGFDLAEESRETASSVISTLGGASYDQPIGVNDKLFYRGNVNHRANNDASFASSVNYDLVAGYNHRFASNNEILGALQIYNADVDGEFNNRGYNLTGQYNLNLSSRNQVGLYLRSGSIDYASQFDIKDIDQLLFGVNWVHVFGGETRLSMVVSTLLGQDEAVESDSPYGRDFSGLRLAFAYPLTHRVNLFTSAGVTESDYAEGFYGASEKRADSLSDFNFGANWRTSKTWLLRATFGVSENSSNVDIFSYDKSLVMFSARSEFL